MLHVFFDLDGTLTDSADGITRCLAYALDRVGSAAPARSELTRFIGTPLPEIFGALLETQDERTLERAVACYVERFYEVGIRENRLYPGVRDGLARLRDLDLALYVATAKTPRAAHEVVDWFRIGEFFHAVHGVDRERVADKAALLCDIVDAGVSADWAIMVGDRHHDILAGRSAGMSTVWANWGYGSSQERDEVQPDHSVVDFASLTELIEDIAG